ncbi:hypothetical protein ACMAZD_26105 (plasmid) [Vibrio sp. nBUS_14]|uniref:Uncharacterized protein n=1 Tax=Vibrio chagasii TaxID=170679 RepID=A0A7V7TFU2_9VIBR|nr:hypothetical protein [Vibrio chagasii]KAB0478820.1 hypothetical protein F7Q91_15720 [Vibrio chagasii]
MSVKFETYTKNLQEMSQLTRVSLCFQFLTLMNLCEQDLDKGKVERDRDDEGKVFFEANSLKSNLLDVPSLSNSHKALYALLDAGFVERRVLNKDGEVVFGNSFGRNSAKIYWRITDKGLSIFGR